MEPFQIEVYQTEDGAVPFQEWLDGLKSDQIRSQIVARIRRASLGNFGDWKSLADSNGIREMRIHSGGGFRIYYALVGRTVVLLLAGSGKGEQRRAIAHAKAYFTDYDRRRRS
ncbi:type II toxin-antitoxin system RelE/ParE family toxin [Jiella sp. M17.18]|uniref:type II toxin-antitoxin system RelE/ParE family toxin n=1 Tax=Jiella sp. M17.18 TaxID=3234247 RepID=UPI0034DECEEB